LGTLLFFFCVMMCLLWRNYNVPMKAMLLLSQISCPDAYESEREKKTEVSCVLTQ
jgi:hypothetical protein